MIDQLLDFIQLTGLQEITPQMVIMWGVSLLLLYMAVYKGFEPLLLVPIGFGALLANLPTRGFFNPDLDATAIVRQLAHLDDESTHSDSAGNPTQTLNANSFQPPLSPPVFFDQKNTPLSPYAESQPDRDSSEKLTAANPPHAPPRSIEDEMTLLHPGLFDMISLGVKWEIFPPLIFLGVGALTDFGPLIANPRMLFLGGAAQLGVLLTFVGASIMGFSQAQCAAIGIIGGADGPTAIFIANKLAPELLGPIAVAAYSYMALVPLIQPPIMRFLTSPAERKIRMKSLRTVSKKEKLIFCLMVLMACIILVPDASALIAMLMLGNFIRECGVTERLLKAAQNEIINVITILLGVSVGITMNGETFLAIGTIKIIVLGVVAFAFATASGVLMAKLMNVFSRSNPINPLIGSAGVSAVPMAARVSHIEGQKADPQNYLLMHAMGPNVAGVIGTAVIAGYFIAALK
ncbi:MAG: sodium ion-translocating decarboxylase subunit beta [Candidatus Methylacidiphilales bacterium]